MIARWVIHLGEGIVSVNDSSGYKIAPEKDKTIIVFDYQKIVLDSY